MIRIVLILLIAFRPEGIRLFFSLAVFLLLVRMPLYLIRSPTEGSENIKKVKLLSSRN